MNFWIELVSPTEVRLLNEILEQDHIMSDQYFALSSSGCENVKSDKFCKRFRRFCAHSDQNGEYMKENCRYSCGCVF